MTRKRRKPIRPDLTPDMVRFVQGDNLTVSGLPFRVRPGIKADGDPVLEWLTPDGWIRPKFDAAMFMTDFYYENEHRLFPPGDGYAGGEYYIDGLRRAVRHGWKHAADYVAAEREWRYRSQRLPGMEPW